MRQIVSSLPLTRPTTALLETYAIVVFNDVSSRFDRNKALAGMGDVDFTGCLSRRRTRLLSMLQKEDSFIRRTTTCRESRFATTGRSCHGGSEVASAGGSCDRSGSHEEVPDDFSGSGCSPRGLTRQTIRNHRAATAPQTPAKPCVG